MHRPILGIVLVVCGFGLAGSCAIDDRTPQAILTLQGDAGPGAGEARLEVTPGAVDLGWVTAGYPSRASVRIRNVGGSPLATPAINLAAGSDADFQIVQNQCLANIPPGESCDVRVQLIPSRAAVLAGALHIESPGGLTADVPLAAEGLAAGALILAPVAGSFEDFGSVRLGEAVQGVFSVSNPSLTPSGPLGFRSNRPEFSVQSTGAAGDCVLGATSLVNGESCNVTVVFAPVARGPVEATLTSRSDGAGSVSATLAGRGLARGLLVASTAQVDFGGVVLGEGIQRGVRFENQGDEALTIGGAALEPASVEGFAILTSDCGSGSVLEGGAACSVQVELRPPRASEEMLAELWADVAEGGQRQSVALRGIGLELGVLTLAPLVAGEEDFGPALVGGGVTRVFQVQNPTPQSSGVLSFGTSEGFEVLGPSEASDCVAETTSLVDGQSCTLRVRFAPARREVARGSLTVSSALAGARSLALVGQGIVPAALDVPSELNFGRVFTNASTSRTLTLKNAGDEPLAPPAFELTSASDVQAAAFGYETTCVAPLAFGEACDITLRLTPSQAVPHSANLRLSSAPGGSATVLLLAEALAPGSLVVSAAAGNDSDFGDVAIGASLERAFTLSNPGNVPSGRLTIRSDSNRFEVSEGECNPADSPGLADGSSCNFSITFTPDSSLQVVGNLSVQSPGAGQTGIELRGRGRKAADLLAVGNRDLGRAIVGQAALTSPDNAFTWTVSNGGDLASGVLTVTNSNAIEFVVSNDTCASASVAGGSTCSLGVRFLPGGIGNRTATLVVADPLSGDSATLVLTAVGFQLAQPGQSCVNAECASGECTRGVCCDRACDGTCQVCSAAGVCADQSGQELCGGGSGRCFGVNRCLLPDGQACGQGTDCGNGNCEQRLGGQGPGDRICCQTDCDALGLQCNAQGQCQQPTLDDGAACGGAGALPCGAGLECKACLGGGNRCTPADRCCGGCNPGYVCIDGDSCGCDVLANGQRGIDCGGGLCIQNRADACCPATPSCSAARPNCDPSDNLCKECVNAAQCGGTNRACNGGVCGCAAGTRDCGGGRCVANTQCCEDCTGGRVCQNATACVCPGGAPFINGQCGCPTGSRDCGGGRCLANNLCCEDCTGDLDCLNGTCGCANGSTPVNGQCGSPLGVACNAGGQCQSGFCTDGVCCNTACQGDCNSCASGTCQATARAACGTTVELPSCSQSPCDIAQVCNIAGNCVSPTVNCLGQTGTVSLGNCCNLPFPESSTIDPTGFVSNCDPGASGIVTVTCDNINDCRNGTTCCLTDFGNFNSIGCRTNCGLNGGSDFTVCASPGGTSPCPSGSCTVENPALPGWLFCSSNG